MRRDKLFNLKDDYKNERISDEELLKRLKSISKEMLFKGYYFESLTEDNHREELNKLKNENASLKAQLKEAKEYLHSSFSF